MSRFNFEDLFSDHMVAQRRSQKTIYSYLSDVAQFFKGNGLAYNEVKRINVLEWVADMNRRDLSSATINRKVGALRAYYAFLIMSEHVTVNPVEGVPLPRIEHTLRNFLKDEEWKKVLDYEPKTPAEAMYQMAWRVMIETGVRVSELTEMKGEDVQKGGIKVRGKGKKERVIYLSPKAMSEIRKYLGGRVGRIFRVTTGQMRWGIKRIAKKAGIVRDVHPHLLRHTFATVMFNNGCPVEVLSKMMGHDSYDTTLIYAKHSAKKIEESAKAYHPLRQDVG